MPAYMTHGPSQAMRQACKVAADSPVMGLCPSAPSGVSKYYVRKRRLSDVAESAVYLEEDTRSGDLVAVKYIPRRRVDYHVENEVLNFSLCQHPRVIKFREVFWTQECLAISMEHAKGGDLLKYINQNGRLSEREAKAFFQQIIAGIDHCHFNDVVLRDIKPENILLVGVRESTLQLKLCDFGVSAMDAHGLLLKTSIGTQLYASPEYLSGAMVVDGKKADVWSTGVLLFMMLYGRHPFATNEELRAPGGRQNVNQRILTAELRLPSNPPISRGARDILRRLLAKAPATRYSTTQIIQHAWFREGLPASFWEELQGSKADSETKLKTRRKWQKVLKRGMPDRKPSDQPKPRRGGLGVRRRP